MSTLNAALEDFVLAAFAFGRSRLADLDRNRSLQLRLGQSSFSFSESLPLLGRAAEKCFGFADGAGETHTLGCIYADYSGWHIRNGFAEMVKRPENLIELDAQFARRGWRVSYSIDRNSWDIFHLGEGFGVRLLPSPHHQAEWEQTAPLAHFCKWLSESDGQTMVHAASIAHCNRGALLVGPGGSGKSGTTLGALKHGLSSAGDDYVLLSPQGAQAVYSTVKQEPSGLKRIGLDVQADLNWQGKVVFRPEDHFEASISRHVPVNAVLLPRIGADRTSLAPVDSSLAFRILTFSTLKQLGSGYAELFRKCGPLIRRLPCFQLNLSEDSQETAAVLKDFFENRL